MLLYIIRVIREKFLYNTFPIISIRTIPNVLTALYRNLQQFHLYRRQMNDSGEFDDFRDRFNRA